MRFDLARLSNMTKANKCTYASLADSMTPEWFDFSSENFKTSFNV